MQPNQTTGSQGDERKMRDMLYRLIISQLLYDGHQGVALALTNLMTDSQSYPPSDRLAQLTKSALRAEEESLARGQPADTFVHPSAGIDLEFQSEVDTISPDPQSYEMCYITVHKMACSTAAFNSNGTLVATGSDDSSIKILDVDRMVSRPAIDFASGNRHDPQNLEHHPVIRTLYDHQKPVTCITFHPRPSSQIVVSGSQDYAIRFFDYRRPNAKKSFKSIQEAHVPTSLAFHPSGFYLMVGTKHPVIRLYDVETFQCFAPADPATHHVDSVTMVNYSPNARMVATSSLDGSIKIWDAVSNRVVNTMRDAHGGQPVNSVVWSRNSKHLLSAGKDSVVRLWDLSQMKCLLCYTGAGSLGAPSNPLPAVFNHTEDYVLFPDEKANSMCSWDSRTGERQRLLSLQHTAAVRFMAHSNVAPGFVTCADDCRARFFYHRLNSGG